MDVQNSLHYQATVMHKLNAELISQHFGMLMLFTLALAHLHDGTKFGVFAAVMGMLCGYITWRMVVEEFHIMAVTVASISGIVFGGVSFVAYVLA